MYYPMSIAFHDYFVYNFIIGDGKNSSRKDTGPLSRSSRISDKIVSKLAGKIGEGWSQFGIQHLGMSKVDIDQFKDNRSTVSN